MMSSLLLVPQFSCGECLHRIDQMLLIAAACTVCFEYILDCILHADCCRRGSKISCELILSWSPFWPTSSFPRAEYLKRASFGMSVAQMFQMCICYHRLPALE